MKKTKLYYVSKFFLQIATQIGWVLTLLIVSIHLFDITILCMIFFSILLCIFMPILYQNINLEIQQLTQIISK